MTKTTIKETTEKYDQSGKLIERFIREEFIEDDTAFYPGVTTTTWTEAPTYNGFSTISTTAYEEAKHDIC